jgi:serine/threonine protein kinase
MKETRVESTVEGFCELLGRSRLLAAEDVLLLEQRWRREAREPADLGAFTKWVVANEYATEFQVAMLLHGHAAHLFLGPYKLLERIGRGDLAMVYKAVHRLGRLAAIKVLPPSKARNPQVLARFQREARLAQGLEHPNMVRALEAGEDQGLHYLVMDYLEGETLQETLNQRGRLTVEEAVDIVYQALLGLQYLHERGLVHRKLEPTNLMLVRPTEESAGPLVKILDISQGRSMLDEPPREGQHPGQLTFEGFLVGTPGYLAPEQARDAHAADIRADIYSLGCILYHALTGQPPFQDTSRLRQIIRHATEAPAPFRECNIEVPEGLERTVCRMMAKDPAQRYQTPELAAADLHIFRSTDRCSPDTAPEDPGEALPATAHDDRAREVEFTPAWDAAPLIAVIDPWPRPGLARQRHSQTRRHRRMGRRDCLLLIAGASGLLAAEAIGWALGQVARKYSTDKTKASGPAERTR